MNRIGWTFAVLCILATAPRIYPQSAADGKRIDGLVHKLGSASFVQREQARKELEAIGPTALDALRRAAKNTDAETARRIAALIARFEEQLLTKQILTPKLIDLKLEGVTVQQAIAAIASKSGYAVQFHGDATPFADKKITLTGKMPFWQAVERLCDQGGLMEQVDLTPPTNYAPHSRIMRGRNKIMVQQAVQVAPAGPIVLTAREKELREKEMSHRHEKWNETKVTFDVNGKTWTEAFKWFCGQTKMPLTGKYSPPAGKINFKQVVDKNGKPREYSCIEIFDIFNEILIADHKLVLLRRETTLMLLPSDEKIPGPLPRVHLAELPYLGKTEIVQVVVPLNGDLKAEEFAPHAKRLLGDFASVTPIPETNSLIVVADVFSIRRHFDFCKGGRLPGGSDSLLTSHSGSVKTEVRVKRSADYAKTKQLEVTLIASMEPNLLNSGIVGRPAFSKFVDDKGRKLQPNHDVVKPAANTDSDAWTSDLVGVAEPMRRFTQFRIKDDCQTARTIKEMSGNLSLQIDLQNVVLAKVAKIMGASGKSVDGANGGTLKILAVKKLANDAIELQVSMENLTPTPLGNNIMINGGNVIIRGNINGGIIINGGMVRVNGNGDTKDLPDLLDAKGQKYRIAGVSSDSVSFVNGASSRTSTIVFQPNAGQGEPRELVLYGTRTHIIAVPFHFENVRLP